MKIVFKAQSDFDVIETKGRKILKKYIDYSTKLFVVEEIDDFKNTIYYTTIDCKLIQIISYENRKFYINYNEFQHILTNLNFIIVSKRTLNVSTGKEIIDEKLVNENGNIVLSRQILAFNENHLENIEDIYIKNEFLKEEERLFWINEYCNYSIENKIKYWLADIQHGMRMQGEATNDPYSEFSVEWYENVKSKDANFDFIFSKAVQSFNINFDWKEYYKRINRFI